MHAAAYAISLAFTVDRTVAMFTPEPMRWSTAAAAAIDMKSLAKLETRDPEDTDDTLLAADELLAAADADPELSLPLPPTTTTPFFFTLSLSLRTFLSIASFCLLCSETAGRVKNFPTALM
jgi:hypothetical protein